MNYDTLPNGARVDRRIATNGHTVGEGAVVRYIDKHYDYARLNFDVPPNAYVECYRLPTYSNPVWIMWQRDMPIMVKPGCQPLETIGHTINRLTQPRKCTGHCWVTDKERREWLAIMADLATYEWSPR